MRRCIEEASRIARVLAVSAERYFADGCPQHAAGIAYRVLFSIVPLAIVLVSIFGIILGQRDRARHRRRHDRPRAAGDRAPAVRDVADAITGIATPSGAVGLVTLVLFAWAATGMMAAIRGGLEVAIHAEADPPDGARQAGRPAARCRRGPPRSRDRRCDVARPHGAAPASTRGLGCRAGGARSSATGMPRVVAVAASVGIVMLLYRFVPSRRLRRVDTLAGAVTTSLLLLAISVASSRLYDGVTRLSVVYGSLTAASSFSTRCTCTRPRCSSAARWRPPGRSRPTPTAPPRSSRFARPCAGSSSPSGARTSHDHAVRREADRRGRSRAVARPRGRPPPTTADEAALAARFAPVVRLVDQPEQCGPGKPYVPTT